MVGLFGTPLLLSLTSGWAFSASMIIMRVPNSFGTSKHVVHRQESFESLIGSRSEPPSIGGRKAFSVIYNLSLERSKFTMNAYLELVDSSLDLAPVIPNRKTETVAQKTQV